MWCCGDDEAGCMASASNAVVAARVVTEGVEGVCVIPVPL